MDSPSAWQGWWPRAAEQHGPPARPRLAQDRRSAAPQCPRRHSHDLPKPVTECGGEGADDVGTTPGTSHRHRGGTSRREHSTIWPVRSATATWSASTTASAGAPSTRTARWPGGCAPGAWSSWPPCPPPCGGSRPEGSTWSPPPSWWRRPRRPDLDEDPSPPGRCRASGRSFCPNGARSQHSTTSVLRPSRLSHPGRVGSDTRPSPLGAVPAGRAASKGRNVDPIAPPVPTDERTSRWQALRSPALATLVVFLALAVWHFRLTWTAPRGATIGGHGDPWLFVWFLKSDQLAVTHAHSPLFSHELNVPGGVTLPWTTSVIMPGVLLAGVTAWLGPVFTYNLLVTLALPLSAWAASLVFRRYVRSQLAAAVGGLLYGFSPYMVAHVLGHLHLILAVTPPLLLALLDEVLVRQRAAPWLLGLALGVVAAAQLLTAEELLASELLAATGALGLLLVAWPLRVQLAGPQRPHTPIQRPGVEVTDLANLVVPTGLQRFAPAAAVAVSDHFTGNGTEWNGYLGVPLLLLLGGIAVGWWRRPLVRVASLLAVGLAVASLGPRLHLAGRITRIHLPWRAVQAIPVLDNLLPNRLMLYVFLLAGLLVAVFTDAVLSRRSPHRRLLGMAAVALALLALLPRSPAPSTPLNVPPLFTSSAAGRIPPGSVALVAPFAHYPPTVAPMLWQAMSGMRFRMPEGYFVGADAAGRAQFGPSATPLSQAMEAIGAGRPPPPPTPTPHATLLGILRGWRVQTVLVGPMGHQASMVCFFTTLLGRPPTPIGGVLAWWDLGHTLTQAPNSQPPQVRQWAGRRATVIAKPLGASTGHGISQRWSPGSWGRR